MNIWTISLFDPTPYDRVGDLRYMQIAQAALQRRYSVTHFTSTFRHTSKEQRFAEETTIKIKPDYIVEYIKSDGYSKNVSIKRALAHRDFAIKLLDNLEGRPNPDIILISMPPLESAYRVTQWAAKRGIPVAIDIIDPWPDSIVKDVPSLLKPIAKAAIFPSYLRLRSILRNSSAVLSISNGYLSWAKSQYGSLRKSQCFYPALNLDKIQLQLNSLARTETRNSDVLRLIYVGSLAGSYDIPTILEAAAFFDKHHPFKTEFVIAGSGPQSGLVADYCNRLRNLSYLGWISNEELMKQYYLADLGFVQHKNNLTQTVTYKLFSYLSAGLPILNSLQSEMAHIISNNEVGLNNENGDTPALVRNIESFLNNREKLETYKGNAIRFTQREGDAPVVYGKMLDLFEELVSVP